MTFAVQDDEKYFYRVVFLQSSYRVVFLILYAKRMILLKYLTYRFENNYVRLSK